MKDQTNQESEPFILTSDGQSTNSTGNNNPNIIIDTPPSHTKKALNNYSSNEHSIIRYFFLFALCLQNSGYTLLRRYSTGILMEHASPSSILIAGELIKLFISFFMTFFATLFGINMGNMPMNDGRIQHFKKIIKTSPKMFVPAFVYYCMNRLSFVALGRIDAGTFTVVAQLKTLTTAAFSFIILRKKFSQIRVRSLVYLVCSVIVISEFAATHSTPSHYNSNDANNDSNSDFMPFMVGLLAVGTEVTLSGLISVYYEKVLKDDKRNLSAWDRNIQLAIFSIILYWPTLHNNGYFKDWSLMSAIISIFSAAGGLLVAFSMKYTDAILKALATSGAIVITSILSRLWLEGPYGIPIAVSSISVVVAIYTYVTDGKTPCGNKKTAATGT